MEKKLQTFTIKKEDGTKITEFDASTKIIVNANNGHYDIELSKDSDFPGIYVTFISDDAKVKDEEDPCVIIEQVADTVEPRAVVYKRGQDEPETIIELTE